MKILVCLLIFCFVSVLDAQVTISADTVLSRDGETVILTCSIPSFTGLATWIHNSTNNALAFCQPSGPCLPGSDAIDTRYSFSATASSIGVTITSFNSIQDTFAWKCQYGRDYAVYVIKHVVPVTTVQLTNTSSQTLSSTLNIVRGGITYIRCSTAPRGSRPPATFQWYSRTVNQSPVLIGNQSISSTPGSVMVPGQPASDLVISYSTLTQTGATVYQNMFIFCEARDEMSTGNYIQSREVQLNIVYPPLVQISPNYSVYNVTEGTKNFVFTCNIIEAKPLPQSNGYSWFHKSMAIQGQVSSSYTIPSVQKSDDGVYKCTAKNDYGSGTSNSLALNVQYPPSIQGLTSPYKVIEGQPLNVTCQVSCIPPADKISWSPNGEGSVPFILYISSVSRNKSGTYSCTAQNTMTPTVGVQQTGMNTSQIQIDVLYPPSIQQLTSPYKVIEKHPLNVTCQVSSNPPPDKISWSPSGESSITSILYISSVSRNNSWTYSCTATNTMNPIVGVQQTGINTSQIQIDVLYPPLIEGLTSPYKVIEYQPLNVTCHTSSNPPPDKVSWSPTGEGSLPSTLYISSVSRNNSGTYSCTAQNTMTPTVGVNQTGIYASQIQIDVLYPPYIWGMNSSYKVIENQPLNVTCQVSSNPPPDKVFWSPTGEGSVPSSLYFSSVSRNNSGTYSCTAQNTMTQTVGLQQTGINTSQIQIDVLYTAKITEFVSKGNITEVMENETFQLYCHVDSNPCSEISLIFRDVLVSVTRDSSELIYSAVAGCLDAGKFICSATNSVMNGVTVSAESNLKVQCHPRLDFRKNISVEYYRALNDIITLNVSIIAYPEPTNIMWYHRATETDIWERVLNQSFSSTGLHSDISVHLGSERDFGDYLVNMSNSFGIFELILHVIPEKDMHSPPELQVGPIAGGVASGVMVAVVCIILVIIFIRRRNLRNKEEGTPLELEGSSQEINNRVSGLVDNPVYETSGQRFGPSASNGTTVAEYAAVVKSKKKTAIVEDPSNVYAQVSKNKENGKKGAAKGKLQKTSREDVYQNVDLAMKGTNADSKYENSRKGACDENVYENPGTITSNNHQANKGAVFYADLMLGPPTTTNGKVVIRGIENRTEYAEIAYDKRGEPLPDSEEEKDDGDGKKKIDE